MMHEVTCFMQSRDHMSNCSYSDTFASMFEALSYTYFRSKTEIHLRKYVKLKFLIRITV